MTCQSKMLSFKPKVLIKFTVVLIGATATLLLLVVLALWSRTTVEVPLPSHNGATAASFHRIWFFQTQEQPQALGNNDNFHSDWTPQISIEERPAATTDIAPVTAISSPQHHRRKLLVDLPPDADKFIQQAKNRAKERAIERHKGTINNSNDRNQIPDKTSRIVKVHKTKAQADYDVAASLQKQHVMDYASPIQQQGGGETATQQQQEHFLNEQAEAQYNKALAQLTKAKQRQRVDPILQQPIPENGEKKVLTRVDWEPQVQYLGILVDAGRHYFSLPWLKKLIVFLYRLRFNYIHLRLTDDQAFNVRLESYPELSYASVVPYNATTGHYHNRRHSAKHTTRKQHGASLQIKKENNNVTSLAPEDITMKQQQQRRQRRLEEVQEESMGGGDEDVDLQNLVHESSNDTDEDQLSDTTTTNPVYTPQELRDLVAFAKLYNISIVPEINVPG